MKMQQAKAIPLDAGTARWIWRSGRTRSSAVPWNVEVLNTDPENFIWEQDKVCGHAVYLVWALYAKGCASPASSSQAGKARCRPVSATLTLLRGRAEQSR